jgi:hypothetical protein
VRDVRANLLPLSLPELSQPIEEQNLLVEVPPSRLGVPRPVLVVIVVVAAAAHVANVDRFRQGRVVHVVEVVVRVHHHGGISRRRVVPVVRIRRRGEGPSVRSHPQVAAAVLVEVRGRVGGGGRRRGGNDRAGRSFAAARREPAAASSNPSRGRITGGRARVSVPVPREAQAVGGASSSGTAVRAGSGRRCGGSSSSCPRGGGGRRLRLSRCRGVRRFYRCCHCFVC